MTVKTTTQQEIQKRAVRVREREELFQRLERHVASCNPCRAAGGLDALTPSRSLCVRGRAFLAIWDGLGRLEPR